jgi:hypothetical protein
VTGTRCRPGFAAPGRRGAPRRGRGSSASARDIAGRAGIGERRARVILAQLAAAGIAERRGPAFEKVREFRDHDELNRFLAEYEGRHRSDRERLDAMMRYAETAMCRVRCLAAYFGQPRDEDCGRCDNCRARASGALARRSRPLTPRRGLAPGDRVRHRLFGDGVVQQVEGESVRVDFPATGVKTIDLGYLRRAG